MTNTQVTMPKQEGVRAVWGRLAEPVCEILVGGGAVVMSGLLKDDFFSILSPPMNSETARALLLGCGFFVFVGGLCRVVNELRLMRAERRTKAYGEGVRLNPKDPQ